MNQNRYNEDKEYRQGADYYAMGLSDEALNSEAAREGYEDARAKDNDSEQQKFQ